MQGEPHCADELLVPPIMKARIECQNGTVQNVGTIATVNGGRKAPKSIVPSVLKVRIESDLQDEKLAFMEWD